MRSTTSFTICGMRAQHFGRGLVDDAERLDDRGAD